MLLRQPLEPVEDTYWCGFFDPEPSVGAWNLMGELVEAVECRDELSFEYHDCVWDEDGITVWVSRCDPDDYCVFLHIEGYHPCGDCIEYQERGYPCISEWSHCPYCDRSSRA